MFARDDAALRCARFCVGEHEPLHHARVQPLAYEAQDHAVTYPSAQDFPQSLMVKGVEELTNVDLQDPSAGRPYQRALQRFACLMRRTMRSEAVREVMKLLLVDGLQHQRHRALQDLVLEGGNADGSRLRPVALRDVDPPHRRRAVGSRLRALEERLEILIQPLRVLLRALPIDTACTVLARPAIRLAQPLHVNVVGQRRERLVRQLPCQLCYPFEFR